MEPVIYFNRAFRPESEATVSVRSRALNYGLGCFAGMLVSAKPGCVFVTLMHPPHLSFR